MPVLGGMNQSSGEPVYVSTSQNVSQSQSLNIPAQSDIASELGLLLGAATTPVNTGGAVSQIDSLYNSLGMSTPTSPVSPLATAGKISGLNINQILIYGALAIAAVLIFKKYRGS